jgi:hypothetical protein
MPPKEMGGESAAVMNATQPLEVMDENGKRITLKPPIPDVVELLNDMIAAGELSPAQGTFELLKVFIGESSPADLFGTDQVSFESGWGLAMQAAGLLEELEDSQEREVLLRLMNVLSPDPERLALDAHPENESSRAGKTARTLGEQPHQVGVLCGLLWAEGFAGGAADPQVCLLFREFTFKSREVKIYYPEVKGSNPSFMRYVNEAEVGIRESLDRLSVYFYLPNINVIFTELEGPRSGILA